VEIWLARQWQHILGFAVGIRENFFGVGGNSLDVARVIDAILTEFGIQLPMNVLTDYPTVERLATLLRGHAGRLSGPLVAIQTATAPVHRCSWSTRITGRSARTASSLKRWVRSSPCSASRRPDSTPTRNPAARCGRWPTPTSTRSGRNAQAAPICSAACAIGAAIAYEMAVRLDDVRLLAAIDTELLDPPDTGTESWSQAPPRQSDLPQILVSWQERDLVPENAAPEFVARSLGVWRANRDARARLAAIAVHRADRRLRPAADHDPADDRCPAETRVRRGRAPGRRAFAS